MKTIEITVSPTGESTLHTKGFTGRDCLEASRQLELALGVKRSEQLTGEFYEAARVQDRLRSRGEEA